MKIAIASILMFNLAWCAALKADASGPQDGAPVTSAATTPTQPDSRADEINSSRAQKSQNLKPDSGSKLEERVIALRHAKYVEDVVNGPDGFGPVFGGLAVSQGFAAGVQYRRRDL